MKGLKGKELLGSEYQLYSLIKWYIIYCVKDFILLLASAENERADEQSLSLTVEYKFKF